MENTQELVSFGIIEGYERALTHQKEMIEGAINLIEAGKIKTKEHLLNYLIQNLHSKGEYLLEMKEFLLEQEEAEESFDEDDIESVIVAFKSAINQIIQ